MPVAFFAPTPLPMCSFIVQSKGETNLHSLWVSSTASACIEQNEEEEEEKILSYFLSSPIASVEIVNLSLSMKVATASPAGRQTYAKSQTGPRQLLYGHVFGFARTHAHARERFISTKKD